MTDIRIDCPVQGKLIPLSAVPDPAFSSGAIGRGGAVQDPGGKVFAPFDGEVIAFMDTKHAIALRSADGIELLIHIGLDTVQLQGQHFTAHVAQGDKVTRGQLLLECDLAAIRAAGYPTTTPVVVTNADQYGTITLALGPEVIVAPPAAASSQEEPPSDALQPPEERTPEPASGGAMQKVSRFFGKIFGMIN